MLQPRRPLLFCASALIATVTTELIARVDQQAQLPPRIDRISTIVHASDSSGQPVTDLRADELRIFEDDAPQQLAVFRTAGADSRMFILLIDDMHIAPADSILARQVIRQLRDEVLRENDLIAIVSTGFSSIQRDLVRDRLDTRINESIQKVMGSAFPMRTSATPASTVSRLHYNAMVAFRTARDLITAAARRADQAKAFIYVSGGYHFDPATDARFEAGRDLLAASPGSPASDPFRQPNPAPSEADVIAALATLGAEARRANVVIHAIDPKGAQRGPSVADGLTAEEWRKASDIAIRSLRALSLATGGVCACESNTIRAALQRIDREHTHHYVLAYTTNSSDPTRLRRRIRIETTRPGVALRYLPDYFLPSR